MSLLNKLLVVDDSQLIHNMYRLVMNRYQGCKILDAMNGLEALDILSKEKDFDIILLDINMPVMNGIQFMEKLHNENLCRDIPIIVISTEGREEDTLRALKLGAAGYVVKPFKPHMLHELIEKIMARRKGSVQSAATARV
ncbi:MAG TPA: response regulator [Thermodesulfovibrionales bacterium]|nr:response regulator [Thermodesulfovibrionales bacterium]